MNLKRISAWGVAFSLINCANAHEAHVHGAAKLEVAQEGPSLTVHLESPLINLFGFERAPRSAAERAVVQQAVARLRDGEAIFMMSPPAGCRLESVQLDFGALTPAFTAASESAAKALPASDSGGEHADLDADYSFGCKTPAALHQIDVRLFEAFPGVMRVAVQLVTPKAQAGTTLTRDNSKLSW